MSGATNQFVSRAAGALLGVFAVIILMPPTSARGEAPAAATNEPSPNLLQEAGTDLGNYADRAAPLLPTDPDSQQAIEVVPGTIGVPATTASPSPGGSATGAATTSPTTNSTEPPAKKGEWIIAPLPNYSPTFGWGIIGRAGYIFPLNSSDKVSPPSVVGAFGYYSQNSSWMAGMGTKLYLDEDRYRVTAAVMHGEFNYDFSGIGTAAGESGQSVPLGQKMTGGIFETLFQVAPHVYLGPKYIGSGIHIDVDTSNVNPAVKIPSNEVMTTLSGLGLHVQWDTRDSQFYPRKGHLADVDLSFHDPAIGDSFAYQVYTLSYNQYISLAENQVLALRGFAQCENGDVPFYALSKFGRGSDLRGYRVGQFQDQQMFAVQGEYRLEITKRIGAVAFAGLGEVMPSLSDITVDDLLPSGGVGLRYVIAEQNHVALRMDVAWGREGSQFYLTVGEAF
jgi:Omp85 superfamily domain